MEECSEWKDFEIGCSSHQKSFIKKDIRRLEQAITGYFDYVEYPHPLHIISYV